MNIAQAAFDSINTADPRPTALVIGAGFGGLAAAIRLGAKGYRVRVLEKLATSLRTASGVPDTAAQDNPLTTIGTR